MKHREKPTGPPPRAGEVWRARIGGFECRVRLIDQGQVKYESLRSGLRWWAGLEDFMRSFDRAEADGDS